MTFHTSSFPAMQDIVEDIHTGDMICRKCGLVAECVIDQRTEWRTFASVFSSFLLFFFSSFLLFIFSQLNTLLPSSKLFSNEDGDDPSRVGGPMDPFMDGMPLTTSISRQDGGSGLSRELNRAQMRAQTVSSLSFHRLSFRLGFISFFSFFSLTVSGLCCGRLQMSSTDKIMMDNFKTIENFC